MDKYLHPTGNSPKRVNLIALGHSCTDWIKHGLQKGRPAGDEGDEVWTVNRGLRVFRSDCAFVLDHIPTECATDPSYGEALACYPGPIITTVTSGHVQRSIRYPSKNINQAIRAHNASLADPYWHNSVPMVLAYAWYIGVEELVLWGADYMLDDGRVIEADRANAEYWVGWCRARGMRIGVPRSSNLLNARRHEGLHIYGLLDQGQAMAWLLDEGHAEA